ncbi:MAG: hypothetical protein ACFCU4_00050 [Puniceicoccaceae bacterium]
MRIIPAILASVLFFLTLIGCQTPGEGTSRKGDEGSPKTADRGAGDKGTSEPFVQVDPNVFLGSVVWSDPSGQFAVVRLENKYPVENRYLIGVDPNRQTIAILRTTLERQGRSVGVRVLEGRVIPGVEVLLPSRFLSQQLRHRFDPAFSEEGAEATRGSQS